MSDTAAFHAFVRRGIVTCLAAALLSLGCGDAGDSDLGSAGETAQPAGSAGRELEPSEEVKLMAQAAGAPVPAEMRIFAIQQLGKLGTPDTVAPITLALMDSDPQVVSAALAALPDTDDPAALEALRRASEHEDAKVRAAAEARMRKLD